MTRYVVVGIGAVVLMLLAYQSVWSAEWVYEDRATLTSATTNASWQRAVTAWTWRMTPTPERAHAVNLLLHVGLAALLGVTAWRLGLTVFGAWIAALTWLLHPMAVQTVAYATGRAEQIMAIGTLLAMTAAAGRWWRPLNLVGIALGVLLAISGKQAGVVALLLVPLTIWVRRGHATQGAPLWAPWWLPTLIALELIWGGVVWYGGLRAVVNADLEVGLVSVTALTWDAWLLAQAGAVWYWLLATVWPALLTPDLDVDRLSGLVRGFGLFTLIVAAGVAWRCRTDRPLVTVALGWFLMGLVPRLIVQTPRSYLNAYHFAVSFMGLAVLAGYGIERLRAQWTPQGV